MPQPISVEAQAAEILAAIPPAYRRTVEARRKAGEVERWACGELVNEWVEEFGERYSRTAIHLAAATLYECTQMSVRDRAWVSREVTPEWRARYPDLHFHHWRACLNAKDPLELAEQVFEHKAAYGALPRVDTIYSWAKASSGATLLPWMGRWERLVSLAEALGGDPYCPERIRLVAAGVLDAAKRMAASVKQ